MSEDNIIKKHILEMFTSRNYKNIKEEKIRDENIIEAYFEDEKIWAFYEVIPKLSVEQTNRYISICIENDINHILLVYDVITPPALKAINENIGEQNIRLEQFAREDLMYNPTKHELVFPHKKVPYSVIKDQSIIPRLPILFTTDPMAKYYGFQEKDLIEITNKYTGVPYYRIVRRSFQK
jgi:DNA-directed RNA polymerase subunit H (RpoH/RPB5)